LWEGSFSLTFGLGRVLKIMERVEILCWGLNMNTFLEKHVLR